MIRNVLVHIEHIAVYPIVSLVLFLLVFAGATLWALSINKAQAAAYGRMPLEDSTDSKGDKV
jgi:cbb3-type cytochrome oxidase subunit 3